MKQLDNLDLWAGRLPIWRSIEALVVAAVLAIAATLFVPRSAWAGEPDGNVVVTAAALEKTAEAQRARRARRKGVVAPETVPRSFETLRPLRLGGSTPKEGRNLDKATVGRIPKVRRHGLRTHRADPRSSTVQAGINGPSRRRWPRLSVGRAP